MAATLLLVLQHQEEAEAALDTLKANADVTGSNNTSAVDAAAAVPEAMLVDLDHNVARTTLMLIDDSSHTTVVSAGEPATVNVSSQPTVPVAAEPSTPTGAASRIAAERQQQQAVPPSTSVSRRLVSAAAQMDPLNATTPLYHQRDEQAFWLLCTLMDRLSTYYDDRMTGMQVAALAFQRALCEHRPKLAAKLVRTPLVRLLQLLFRLRLNWRFSVCQLF